MNKKLAFVTIFALVLSACTSLPLTQVTPTEEQLKLVEPHVAKCTDEHISTGENPTDARVFCELKFDPLLNKTPRPQQRQNKELEMI